MLDSVLRHEDDVGAAAVMMLALLRLLGVLEAGELAGLADGDIRRQDARLGELHDKARVRVLLHITAKLMGRRSLVEPERILLVGDEEMNAIPIR